MSTFLSGAWELFWIVSEGPLAHMVKNPPAMQETQVRSLGQEDSLEKEMATYSSILAWEMPWTEDFWQATVFGVTKTRM